jgi:glutaredoxin-like protein DUF836
MNDSKLILSLYSRPDCHLCEEMLDGLAKWQSIYNFEIAIIDIDQDPSLLDRFAARIPLLAADDIEICQYHFDEKAFLQYFEGQ